jgi:hypothetical protein
VEKITFCGTFNENFFKNLLSAEKRYEILEPRGQRAIQYL